MAYMLGHTASHFEISQSLFSDTQPVITVVYILVAVMHIESGLSLKDCTQLLCSLRCLVRLMVEDFNGADSRGKYLEKSIPIDARTVINRLALKPSYTAFVSCPKCSTCYLDNGPSSYPSRCSAEQPLIQQICGQRLQKARVIQNREYTLPVRHFLYHNFKEWLGEMLCRPGMEDLMDRDFSPSSSGVMEDIWDAPGLYKISGVDGRPFIRNPTENEGRYVFSFNMDGFNPFQLKQAGRAATVMGLYMVCLNLPPEERFKSENMFLAGIIPGPKEPSMEQINHFLSPLVDDLLDSYTNGVHYTRTWNYPNGRNTRSALALIICDLPAARQAMGFTSHQSANFCSYCKLQLRDINNLDHTTWEPRSCMEHRRLAFEWRDARSETVRLDITKTHGVRYSEFLRLPYFDPILSVCVDPMHAFFLRILSHHCRDIWGMDIGIEDGDGTTTDPVSAEVRSSPEFQRAYLAFRIGTLEKLRTFKTKTLAYLAKDRGIPSKGKRLERLIEQLTKYVSTVFILLWLPQYFILQRRDNGWFDSNENLISPLTAQEQEAIEKACADRVSDEYSIPISEAHTAMEFYLFGASTEDFSELSTLSLAHLYFVKVQKKPPSYNAMEMDEQRTWNNARMKTIRNYSKSKLIKALMEAVRATELSNYNHSDNLREQRENEGIIDNSHAVVNPNPGRLSIAKQANSSRGKTRVLGRSRLKEIWNDMEKTTLPSWCNPAPPRTGEKGQGKISADGWRVFCTVNLIVTLGRLWGPQPADSREKQLLVNFCDLIAAIKFAAGRSVTTARAEEFRVLMLKYLHGLVKLFPAIRIVPYHHLAIHMTELLSHFGPTTAWRCWVFERYNHMLQNIETNGRFGT